MKSTATRLYVIIAIIAVSYGGAHVAQIMARPPEIELPNWTLADLPMQLEQWRGEKTELDPQIAVATGAVLNELVGRIYRDDAGRAVALHMAMFDDPTDGVLHSPLNCYREAGWTKLSESREDVKVAEDMTIAVNATTWEREGEKVMVVYWYQLGRQLLYGRLDLGAARWALRGTPKWPVLFKVMLQTAVVDPDESKAVVFELAQRIGAWLNQPAHRPYLDRW